MLLRRDPTPSVGGGLAALLVLADGRFPSGGHAHSGGVEAAVADGRIGGPDDLASFLLGRLHGPGVIDAGLAATAAALVVTEGGRAGPGAWAGLDAQAAARCPSPALRASSRRQGRSLLRAARRIWADPRLDSVDPGGSDGPFAAVVLGAAAGVAGLTPIAAATAAAHASVAGPASAATRLLGLDPYDVAAVVARLAPAIDAAAEAAAGGGATRLPAPSSPLLDIGAEEHATWEVRLFAS